MRMLRPVRAALALPVAVAALALPALAVAQAPAPAPAAPSALAARATEAALPGAAAAPLLFVSNRSGQAQIHRIRADGSADQALTQGPHENTEPAWSPDGQRVAFTSYRDGNAEIYVMQADGSQQRRLTHHPQSDNAPAWTPDGRIVFRSTRSRWTNVYVMDADGSNLQALTESPTDKGPPLLSPDGRWIAYVAHSERGNPNIHVLSTQGGPVRDLTGALSKNQKTHPAWAPDSTRLAYVESKDLAANIHVIQVDGTQPVALTRNVYTNAHPAWSPDGRRIAFVSSREGTRTEMARGDIYVMQADGNGQTNLTRHPDEDSHPVWSADGASIYFMSLRDGRSQLYRQPADGSPAQRLTRSDGFDLMARPLTTGAGPAH